ncbi:sensor histidine kinase [Longirhabdus pacifica]|uniref:sensor histidine kinase n=1 Tax=Longirhabdus pacifica TaxID=2305227 RepID=UPI0013E8E7A3|nr:HAMP domain-containing sensor histidine kinase [Longirhabdus pacifica]
MNKDIYDSLREMETIQYEIIERIKNIHPNQAEIERELSAIVEQEEYDITLLDGNFEMELFNSQTFGGWTTRDSWFPIIINNQVEYFITVSFEIDGKKLGLQEALMDILVFFQIMLFIAFGLLILYFQDKITTPLNHLIRRFKKVNLYQKLPPLSTNRKDEIHELYTRFNDMEKRIRVSYAEQMNMIAAIAHDLKTPLTSMKGFLELMESNAPSEKQKQEYIMLMEKKTDFMEQLIQEFSLFFKNELELEQMEQKKVNMASFFRSICEEYEAELEGLGYACRSQHDLSDDVFIFANEKMLRRVFANIIGNAVRHAEHKDLLVRLHGYQHGDDVVMSIEDNGHGVPKQELPYLFQKFYTVDKSRRSEETGTGLGLAITKSIAEKHGGKVEASLTSEGGLSIIIRIPLYME